MQCTCCGVTLTQLGAGWVVDKLRRPVHWVLPAHASTQLAAHPAVQHSNSACQGLLVLLLQAAALKCLLPCTNFVCCTS